MNKIDEIKERIGLRSHMKLLCNAPKLPDSIIGMTYLNAEDDVIYLLSIIESVEQDLSIIANSENVSAMNSIAEESLKAIRGN